MSTVDAGVRVGWPLGQVRHRGEAVTCTCATEGIRECPEHRRCPPCPEPDNCYCDGAVRLQEGIESRSLGVCVGATWEPGRGVCARCGRPTINRWFCRAQREDSNSCRLVWIRNHYWSDARIAAKKRDGDQCIRCGSRELLEVNHIQPLGDGSHSQRSCRHHLDNLETLCHQHHVAVTREQRSRQKTGVSNPLTTHSKAPHEQRGFEL